MLQNKTRIIIAFLLISLPCVMLIKGIYGSFVFTFSIPFLWELCYLGNGPSALGIRKKLLGVSIASGIGSGVIIGLIGGKILQILNLTGFSFADGHNLQLSLGSFEIKFSLAKELSYRLLGMSDTPQGLLLYFAFSILAIGLGEEIFWRGFIQKKIAARLKTAAAIWITALLFALIHFYVFILLPFDKGMILLVLIGIVGAIWGYLYAKTENIWSVAMSHGVVAAIIWKYYFFT